MGVHLTKSGKKVVVPGPKPGIPEAVTQERKDQLLIAYRECGHLPTALQSLGIVPSTLRTWKMRDKGLTSALDLIRRKYLFLTQLRKIGTVYGACKSIGISRPLLKRWMDEDPPYKTQVDEAMEDSLDLDEAEVVKRGRHGWQEPVFYKGEEVARVTKKSDALLMFRLRGRRGDVFRDRADITGANGGPLQLQLVERLQAGRKRLVERKMLNEAPPADGEIVGES